MHKFLVSMEAQQIPPHSIVSRYSDQKFRLVPSLTIGTGADKTEIKPEVYGSAFFLLPISNEIGFANAQIESIPPDRVLQWHTNGDELARYLSQNGYRA